MTPEGFPFQTLSYINGPGYNYHRVLSNVSEMEMNDTLQSVHTWRNLNQTEEKVLHGRYEPHHAGYWMDYETHGGEDVPIYAVGKLYQMYPFYMEQ